MTYLILDHPASSSESGRLNDDPLETAQGLCQIPAAKINSREFPRASHPGRTGSTLSRCQAFDSCSATVVVRDFGHSPETVPGINSNFDDPGRRFIKKAAAEMFGVCESAPFGHSCHRGRGHYKGKRAKLQRCP